MRALIALLMLSLTGCASLSSLLHPPFTGCKDMCGAGRAQSCTANEFGENCQCSKGEL